MNEQQTIAAVQTGDKQAFGALYDAYLRKIYQFVYYKTLHKETAEDIVSTVFIKALNGIGSYNPDKGKFISWLYKIAQNAVADHYRKGPGNELNVEDIWGLASLRDMEIDAQNNLLLDKVHKHLGQLSLQARDILIMRIWQQMSYKEIAESIGKTEAGVKMAVSRSLKKIRFEVMLGALVYLYIV